MPRATIRPWFGTRGLQAGFRPANPPLDFSNLLAEAVAAAKSADAVIYVGGLNHRGGYDTEGVDRADIKLPGEQDELIQKIVQANPRTVVVLIGGGPWRWMRGSPRCQPCFTHGIPVWKAAMRWRAPCFGDVNPSGKLPCTFPKRLADSPAHALNAYPGTNGTVTYTEGLLVGYRWFDAKKIEPLFPFGHGLSYTTFKYSKLNLVPAPAAPGLPVTVGIRAGQHRQPRRRGSGAGYVQEAAPACRGRSRN